MTEPQVWTMIIGFFAVVIGMMTIVSTLFLRVIHAEVGGLRREMTLELSGISGRLDRLETRFDRLEAKVDAIDRDVQALMKREFGH